MEYWLLALLPHLIMIWHILQWHHSDGFLDWLGSSLAAAALGSQILPQYLQMQAKGFCHLRSHGMKKIQFKEIKMTCLQWNSTYVLSNYEMQQMHWHRINISNTFINIKWKPQRKYKTSNESWYSIFWIVITTAISSHLKFPKILFFVVDLLDSL